MESGTSSAAPESFARRVRLHLRAFRQRVSLARELPLGRLDKAKWALMHYAAWLGRFVPALRNLVVRVRIRYAGRSAVVHLRAGSSDGAVLHDVFCSCPYRLPDMPVRRVLDLGGNIGLAGIYFSLLHPDAEVAFIEPLPANQTLLTGNVLANRLRGRIFRGAIGLADGTGRFYVGETENSSLLDRPGLHTGAIDIATYSVETVMREMGWEAIDVLKIDIEGYEKVLLGAAPAWLSKVRVIVGELHDGYSLEALRRDIGPYGFRCEQRSADFEYQKTGFAAFAH